MTFEECCQKCVSNESLVKQFNRLTGHNLGAKRTPIQLAIDESCNYNPNEEAFPDFCQFVFNYVWFPLAGMKK